MAEAEIRDGAGEGEDDGNIRPALNPFEQPPILKVFFEHVAVEDLAKCQLVSKLWYKEALSTWRSKVTIKIEGRGKIVSTRNGGFRRPTSLGEFLDSWEAGEWSPYPFRQYVLDWWDFEAKEDVGQQRFLELVGGHITSLTLEKCSFVNREKFRRIVYQAFPKLQFLKVDDCLVKGSRYFNWAQQQGKILAYKEPAFGIHGLKSLDISDCLPDTMMEMLSHFHKVKRLRMRSTDPLEYGNLLETIKLIRAQDQTKLPLKDFDVSFALELGPRTASTMELLKLHDQLNLPFQRLEVWFSRPLDCNLNNEDVFRDILHDRSSTLKYLEFRGIHPYGTCQSFPFGVCLENLEELVLSYHFCGNLNYLRATPNLRVLRMDGGLTDDDLFTLADNLFSNSTKLEIDNWTLPSLKELTDFCFLPLSVSNLGKLMKWMPNLERLERVKLNDVTFSMVCKNWKNLTHLEDLGITLTDEGVLGIESAQEAGGDEGTQSVPNITNLKNLTSFSTRSSKLTSASVHEGFLKLDNLKELTFGSINQIDDDAKAALERQNIKLGKILITMCCRLH